MSETELFPAIIFKPLTAAHFGLLEIWLNAEHVSRWYGENKSWSWDDIHEKYRTYVDGYRWVGEIKKPIRGFIIIVDAVPVGYIQYYYTYDFPYVPELNDEKLPLDLASIDLFIGEIDYIGKGLGQRIIRQFLDDYIWTKFDACFVDPDTANSRAVHAYKKVGFTELKMVNNGNTTWMLATKDPEYKPKKQCKPLCCCAE